MNGIHRIDKDISTLAKKIEEEVKGLTFEEICEFNLDEEYILEIPWGTLKYAGIYLIEIKNDGNSDSFMEWITHFKSKWEDEKYLKCFTPNLKKKRICQHSELTEWIPMYLGKSKRIERRFHDHIFKELHKTTFALKLKARENIRNERFRLKTIKCELENYNMIVPAIEAQLRNRINPIIGKQ